jgi:hypothetical protein
MTLIRILIEPHTTISAGKLDEPDKLRHLLVVNPKRLGKPCWWFPDTISPGRFANSTRFQPRSANQPWQPISSIMNHNPITANRTVLTTKPRILAHRRVNALPVLKKEISPNHHRVDIFAGVSHHEWRQCG